MMKPARAKEKTARKAPKLQKNPKPREAAPAHGVMAEDIVIYRDARGDVTLRADVAHETVWATLNEISALFGVQKAAISKHLGHIFETGELSEAATVSKMETVQTEGNRSVRRSIEYFNLDAIISVGYRVNSKQATLFRKWATATLRAYILKGYAVNEHRLKQSHAASIRELGKTLALIQGAISRRALDQDEVDGLLSVIHGYANSWMLLERYDEGGLAVRKGKGKEKKPFAYGYVRPAIDRLAAILVKKGEASALFGSERDETFKGVLLTIYQTFGGKELYGSLEEKAAHLLYFVIKDHPFSDGNKRIGSFLFILFMERNGLLYGKGGERKVGENALVALALLVAESKPEEKDGIVALITHLIA